MQASSFHLTNPFIPSTADILVEETELDMDERLTESVKAHMTETLLTPIVGIASIDRFSNAPDGHKPQDLLPGAQSVIAMVFPLLRANLHLQFIMEEKGIFPDTWRRRPRGRVTTGWQHTGGWGPETVVQEFNPRRQYYSHIYGRTCYETQCHEYERIAYQAAMFLEKQGYYCLMPPVASGATFSPPPDPSVFGSIFSFRHACVAAGLGELAPNGLFMTPEHGPRVRIGAIITTAPLKPTPMIMNPLCLHLKGTECLECLKACPQHIFGPPFDLYELKIGGKVNLQARSDPAKCLGRTSYCRGVCHYACPIGRQAPFIP